MERACELLGAYCPVIEETLFREGLEILARPGALSAKMRLARRVRRRLRIYAKYMGLQGPQAYAQLLWQQAKRRLIRQRRSKALTAGGAVIAFVGPEATGKSTLVAESARWLGSAFVVRSIHAGKPPGTLPTLPLNALLPFLREKAGRSYPRQASGGRKGAQDREGVGASVCRARRGGGLGSARFVDQSAPGRGTGRACDL
jgi:hypothetical protein